MEVPLWAAFLALAVALGCIVMVLLTVSLHRFRTGVLVVIVDPKGALPTLPQDDTPESE